MVERRLVMPDVASSSLVMSVGWAIDSIGRVSRLHRESWQFKSVIAHDWWT